MVYNVLPSVTLGFIFSVQNYSGGAQPGSLEALKNMIFKLQQEAIHTDSEDEGSRSKLSERVTITDICPYWAGFPILVSQELCKISKSLFPC